MKRNSTTLAHCTRNQSSKKILNVEAGDEDTRNPNLQHPTFLPTEEVLIQATKENSIYGNRNITTLASSKHECIKRKKEKERHLHKKCGYRNLEKGEPKCGWLLQALAVVANVHRSNSEHSDGGTFNKDENNESRGSSCGEFKHAMFHRLYFYLLSN